MNRSGDACQHAQGSTDRSPLTQDECDSNGSAEATSPLRQPGTASLSPNEVRSPSEKATPQLSDLVKLATSANSIVEFIGLAVTPLIEQGMINAAWLLSLNREVKPRLHAFAGDAVQPLWECIRDEIGPFTERLKLDGDVRHDVSRHLPEQRMFVARLHFDQQSQELLIGLIDQRVDVASIESRWMAIAFAVVQMQFAQRLECLQVQNGQLAQWLTVGQSMLSARDVQATLINAVNGFKNLVNADFAAIALCDERGRSRRLAALSDVESFDPASPTNKRIETVVAQALDSPGNCVIPAADPMLVNPVVQRFCQENSYSGCLVNRMQTADGKLKGAVLIAGSAEKLTEESRQKTIEKLTRWLAEHLTSAIDAKASVWARLKSHLTRLGRHPLRRIALGISLLLRRCARRSDSLSRSVRLSTAANDTTLYCSAVRRCFGSSFRPPRRPRPCRPGAGENGWPSIAPQSFPVWKPNNPPKPSIKKPRWPKAILPNRRSRL